MRHCIWIRCCRWLMVPLSCALAGPLQARQKTTAGIRIAETSNSPATPVHALDRTTPSRQEYVIGPEDVLAIDVWHQPEISRVEPVRPDGKITLPLVGDVEASGKTTDSLQGEIAQRLTNYIHDPAVTVIVQDARSHRFSIIGDVLRPGSYPLATQMSVLDAIAVAGGFGEFAKVTNIYVVRPRANGSSLRIPFNYKAAVRGNRRDLDLDLAPGDIIIVP